MSLAMRMASASSRNAALRARDAGDAEALCGALGLDLVAHDADMLGLRADEGDVVMLQHLGEAGVLGEEAVAGMDGVRAGDLAGGDQRRDVEIAVAGGRRADADALVGEAHMHGVGVGGGMDRDGGDAEFLGGAQDAQGDLAPVGDEDLVEHRALLDHEQRLAVFDGRAVLDEDRRDGAGARRDDLVEGLHGLDEQNLVAGLNLGADLDEVLGLRRGLAVGGADHRRQHGARMGRAARPCRGRSSAAAGGGATTAAGAAGADNGTVRR